MSTSSRQWPAARLCRRSTKRAAAAAPAPARRAPGCVAWTAAAASPSHAREFVEVDDLGDGAKQSHRRLMFSLAGGGAALLQHDDLIVAVMGIARSALHRPGAADAGQNDAFDLARPQRGVQAGGIKALTRGLTITRSASPACSSGWNSVPALPSASAPNSWARPNSGDCFGWSA